jgi:hypothetical protein
LTLVEDLLGANDTPDDRGCIEDFGIRTAEAVLLVRIAHVRCNKVRPRGQFKKEDSARMWLNIQFCTASWLVPATTVAAI